MKQSWLALALSLGAIVPAHTAEITTPVAGTFNNSQENACIHVTLFMFLADCSYARSFAKVAGQDIPWVGPTVNPVYYAPDSEHAVPEYVPVVGDDRIAPTLEGTLTVHDNNTEDPADDRISATLVVGPTARSVVVNVNELAGGPAGDPPRAVMSWSSNTHTLAKTPVNFATPNEHGGVDYVIGSKGFPDLICTTSDPEDCFPSALAGRTVQGQDAGNTWSRPSPIGFTRDTAMDGNVGATTSAVMADYRCVDNRNGITCPSHNVVWSNEPEADPGKRSVNEGAGLDNLVLRVSTDESGRVLSAAGFWTQEYMIAAGPKMFQVPAGHNNSWQGGYMQMKGGNNQRAQE